MAIETSRLHPLFGVEIMGADAIVDSQVHVWGADTPDRPWPPDRARRRWRIAIGGERIHGSILLLPEGSANVGA